VRRRSGLLFGGSTPRKAFGSRIGAVVPTRKLEHLRTALRHGAVHSIHHALHAVVVEAHPFSVEKRRDLWSVVIDHPSEQPVRNFRIACCNYTHLWRPGGNLIGEQGADQLFLGSRIFLPFGYHLAVKFSGNRQGLLM